MQQIKLLLGTLLFLFIIQGYAQEMPKKILITYYSKTGHTASMAKEVARGASEVKNCDVVVKQIEQTSHKDLLEADAIIVGGPVHNANIASEVVTFIDNWPFEGAPLQNKIGAAFVSAGGISSGEELAQVNILHSMMIFGMIVVGGNDWKSPFGASLITNEKGLQNPTMEQFFLKKGFDLGKRVAEITSKLKP